MAPEVNSLPGTATCSPNTCHGGTTTGVAPRGVDADVKMPFAPNNAMFDAGIVAWDNKIAFDSVRPVTAIRYLYRGQSVSAWGGPYQGTKTIDGGRGPLISPRPFPLRPSPSHGAARRPSSTTS